MRAKKSELDNAGVRALVVACLTVVERLCRCTENQAYLLQLHGIISTLLLLAFAVFM